MIDPALRTVAAIADVENANVGLSDRAAGHGLDHDVGYPVAHEVRAALSASRERGEPLAPLICSAARTLIGACERRVVCVQIRVPGAVVGARVERVAVAIDELLDFEIVERRQHWRRRRRLLRRCSTESNNEHAESCDGDRYAHRLQRASAS